MTLRQLKWVSFVLPAVFLVLLEVVRHYVLQSHPTLLHHGPPLIGMVAGVAIFTAAIFRLVGRMNQRILLQNQELYRLHQLESKHIAQFRALNEAGISTTSELSLEAVHLLAIAREGLTNVARHAQATGADRTPG